MTASVRSREPVLVGIGVATQRGDDPLAGMDPLGLMLEATRAAGADAGDARLLSDVARVYVPQGRWRYGDAGGYIARSVGASRATSIMSKVGVLQQSLIGEACESIANGEIEAALVVGGEAGHRRRRGELAGLVLPSTDAAGSPDVVLRPDDELLLDVERDSGLGHMAVGYYAIVESAFRAASGIGVEAHRRAVASLYHRMSETAARNPAAWNRTPVSEAQILDATGRNRMLAFPYSVLHNASWSVDQAAALLFCSQATAERFAIPPEKWVFPLSSSESNHITSVSSRVELGRCPGAGIAGSAALDHAGLAVADLDRVELYSCFPVAVETYGAALGIPLDGEVTVTGGMPFAGGPFNNYVLQSTARMAQLLRETPGSRGLVTSVSGVLTKQGFGVWSSGGPNPAGFASLDVTDRVRREQAIAPVVGDWRGHGTIAGVTVLSEHTPPRAVAVVDVGGGARTVAWSDSPEVVSTLQAEECCGRSVDIEERTFRFL